GGRSRSALYPRRGGAPGCVSDRAGTGTPARAGGGRGPDGVRAQGSHLRHARQRTPAGPLHAPGALLARHSKLALRPAAGRRRRRAVTVEGAKCSRSPSPSSQRVWWSTPPFAPKDARVQRSGARARDRAPSSRFVSIQESFSSLELDLAVSRRLMLHGFAGWNVSGGADAPSRAEIPLSRGPQLRTSAEWAATRLDSLRAELAAIDYRYSNGRRASVATVTGGWKKVLSPDTELMVVAGPGVGRAQADGQPAAVVPYGVAAADGRVKMTRDILAGMGVSVEPLGDPLTGEVVERGSLRASATWGLRGVGTVSATLAGSVAVTSGSQAAGSAQAGDRFLQAELGA